MGKMGEWQVCAVRFKTKRLLGKSLKTVKVSTCCRMRLQRRCDIFCKGSWESTSVLCRSLLPLSVRRSYKEVKEILFGDLCFAVMQPYMSQLYTALFWYENLRRLIYRCGGHKPQTM